MRIASKGQAGRPAPVGDVGRSIEPASRSFVAFVPLSNWLRGFDRYRRVWSKALLPASRYPDAVYLLPADGPHDVGLAKARLLIAKVGCAGDCVVALQTSLPVGPGAAEPNTVTGTGVGWRWPRPEIPLRDVAWVDGEALVPTRIEEVTAAAHRLDPAHLLRWPDCRPRSFSVLPIARACQARCPFCFSKGSVSEITRQRPPDLAAIDRWAALSKARGAERAVITGGGEPTLLPPDTLNAIVRALAARFETTVLITNGARLDGARLRALRDAGLHVLAVSRHGTSAAMDQAIMGLDHESAVLGAAAGALGLRARSICVLQKGGVDDAAGVVRYLERAADEGFDEVCFKELYVSSTGESPWAAGDVSAWCASHQVPLALVIDTLEALGFVRIDALPWGSPLFAGEVRGRPLRVAAYTEPSVGWERAHGIARSWNLLADGRCLASLEDPASELSPPSPASRSPRRLSVV